ncbi:TetR/AcrR family transcriptional regulator [Nakamurella endophytica]|uniref:TetR family transcriptional regulator n=1 Tax=Nakamurella endophytica TaxID=1748367 RepID=A0A917SQ66_9ACTN|nr:TetR/AcrR family transcriptional regulator [Nakamurella endophytica]GGL93304.1 TetR family transcriptional regulator [Nakamurella endophytica]
MTERTARGPYQNGIRRRREIIETASRIFATYGYMGGSLRQIAAEVGVTPAALTRHFDSKEGLLAAVLDNWDAEVDAMGSTGSRGLKYFTHLTDTIVHNRANRGLIELFLTLSAESSNAHHPAREFIRTRYGRVVRQAADRLREARDASEVRWMDDDEIEQQVRALYAFMDGVQLQWLIDPDVDSVAVFSRTLAMIFKDWTGHDEVPVGSAVGVAHA